jgi:hypothetical protein
MPSMRIGLQTWEACGQGEEEKMKFDDGSDIEPSPHK